MASQAPIKVSDQTKARIRYLAALTDATQADIVDRAVSEYAARHATDIATGMERALAILAGGDSAVAAHLLDVDPKTVKRVAGRRSPKRVRIPKRTT